MDDFSHTLGVRDGIAYVLSFYYKEVKLKDVAEAYATKFGQHYTLEWHTK